jgi:hypothetical protein
MFVIRERLYAHPVLSFPKKKTLEELSLVQDNKSTKNTAQCVCIIVERIYFIIPFAFMLFHRDTLL